MIIIVYNLIMIIINITGILWSVTVREVIGVFSDPIDVVLCRRVCKCVTNGQRGHMSRE